MPTTDDPNAALWRPIVTFPDGSPSFVHGFEAGGIWHDMQGAPREFERTVHTENEEVVRRMARHMGYKVEFEATEFEEWAVATFTKQRPEGALHVVGGKDAG